MTWGKVVVLAGYTGFLHQLQLAIHESQRVCEKVDSDLGLVCGLSRVLRFPPPVSTG